MQFAITSLTTGVILKYINSFHAATEPINNFCANGESNSQAFSQKNNMEEMLRSFSFNVESTKLLISTI